MAEQSGIAVSVDCQNEEIIKIINNDQRDGKELLSQVIDNKIVDESPSSPLSSVLSSSSPLIFDAITPILPPLLTSSQVTSPINTISPTTTLAGFQQTMPEWKKELLQKRKNVSKTLDSTPATINSSINNSFDKGSCSIEETSTTIAKTIMAVTTTDTTTTNNPTSSLITTSSSSSSSSNTITIVASNAADILTQQNKINTTTPLENVTFQQTINSTSTTTSTTTSGHSPHDIDEKTTKLITKQTDSKEPHHHQHKNTNDYCDDRADGGNDEFNDNDNDNDDGCDGTGHININKSSFTGVEQETPFVCGDFHRRRLQQQQSSLSSTEIATATATAPPPPPPAAQLTTEIIEDSSSTKLYQVNQSHSRHGQDCVDNNDSFITNVSSSSSSSIALANKLLNCGNSGIVVVGSDDVVCRGSTISATKPPVINKYNKNIKLVNKFTKNTNFATTVVSGTTTTTVNKYLKSNITSEYHQNNKTTTTNNTNNSKMVVMQEVNENFNFDDTNEELQYGPGIVSKLRCRYLSLALRQSAAKQRPSLDNLRRATSLNNLLDEDDEHNNHHHHHHHRRNEDSVVLGDDNSTTGSSGGDVGTNSNGGQCNGRKDDVKNINNRKSWNQKNIQRGNDSLKRARSVEALMRYDQNAWQRDIIKDAAVVTVAAAAIVDVEEQQPITDGTISQASSPLATALPSQLITAENDAVIEKIIHEHITTINTKKLPLDLVTIDDKIQIARERSVATEHLKHPPPKRLTSFMDETERPPPDLVKHTLRIFEASANRRPKPVTRQPNGDVATKVANYKTIINQDNPTNKPAIVYPKPPLSPKKPMITNNTSRSSPKHQPILNGSRNNNNNNGVVSESSVVVISQPTSASPLQSPITSATNGHVKTIFTGGITAPTVMSNGTNNVVCRSPSPLTVRCGSSGDTYRTTKLDSPLSPSQSPQFTGGNIGGIGGGRYNNGTSSVSTTNSRYRADSSYLTSPLSPISSINNHHRQQLSPQQTPVAATVFHAAITTTANVKSVEDSPMHLLAKKIDNLTLNSPQVNLIKDQYGIVVGGSVASKLIENDQNNLSDEQKIDGDKPEVDNGDDDNDETDESIKRISKSALDNISKAGTTTEFRFGSKTTKSYLPNTGAGVLLSSSSSSSTTSLPSPSSSSVSSSPSMPATVTPTKRDSETIVTTSPVPSVRQIGIIRPQLKNPQQQQQPKFLSNNTDINHQHYNNHLLQHDEKSSKRDNLLITNLISSNSNSMLTTREIEKNLINIEKSEENSSSIVAVSGSGVGGGSVGGGGGGVVEEPIVGVIPKWTNIVPKNNVSGNGVGVSVQTTKPWQLPDLQNNSMVFNFSNRKDVPDYLDSDGLVIRRKRELPKPGDSGFVLLGDLTVETSTDPDDSWTLGPPSPCDVEFQNDNIIIGGKSSLLRNKVKPQKLKIQFNDSLTSTFEYPSENSLLLEDDAMDMSFDQNGMIVLNNTTNGTLISSSNSVAGGVGGSGSGGGSGLLGNMAIGSAPLGSYVPLKASLNKNFELGVTRSMPSSSSSSTTTPSPQSDDYLINSTITQKNTEIIGNNGGVKNSINTNSTATTNNTSNTTNDTTTGNNSGNGDSESLQYLKPATDEQTVAWSEGTRVTDLLF